jgi:penicillin-binding protein 1A
MILQIPEILLCPAPQVRLPEVYPTPQGETASGTRVLSASTAFLLTDAMKDVVTSPSGTAYGSISANGQTVAGKTGTTSDYRDIWFVGYTPYYTCCVWGGYDNNEPLPLSSTCHVYNKTLWSAVMDRVHQNLPTADFVQPDSVTSVSLCRESHLIAIPEACPETYTEYFADGTQPTKECNLHEVIPETEPITILDELPGSLESESELLSETETDSESESSSEDESESETLDHTETGSPDDSAVTEQPDAYPSPADTDTETATPQNLHQPDTTSLEDLINRLADAN